MPELLSIKDPIFSKNIVKHSRQRKK